MSEIPLTSLSIYEFYADKLLTLSVFEEIKDLEQRKEIKWLDTSNVLNVNDYSKTGYLQNSQSYFHRELFDWFNNCINEVVKTKFTEQELNICDSWLTKTHLFQKSKRHHHAMSILSGVFYFEDIKNSYLKFYFADPLIEKLHVLLGNAQNLMLEKEKDIQPQCGKLILFPSFLDHEIQLHTGQKPRYSLAFNTFFTGVLSNKASSRLKISLDTL